MSDKRHFTIVEGKKEHGLFVSTTPSGAARKVVSKLSSGKKVKFYLREITQGSKKKVYGPYEGMKKKLSKPIKVGDRVYKYEPVVKKMKGGWGTGQGMHELKFPVGDDIVTIVKESPGLFQRDEAKYSVNVFDQVMGKSFGKIKSVSLDILVNYLTKSYPNKMCQIKEFVRESAERESSWNNLYKALICNTNKERNIKLVNETINFGNWLQEDPRREQLYMTLNERTKQEKYGKPNGTIDYHSLKNNILQQINIDKKYGKKGFFNSLF